MLRPTDWGMFVTKLRDTFLVLRPWPRRLPSVGCAFGGVIRWHSHGHDQNDGVSEWVPFLPRGEECPPFPPLGNESAHVSDARV